MATHSLNWVVLSLSDYHAIRAFAMRIRSHGLVPLDWRSGLQITDPFHWIRIENPFPWIGNSSFGFDIQTHRVHLHIVTVLDCTPVHITVLKCTSVHICRIVHRYIRIEVYIGKFILIKRYDDTFNRIGLYIGTSNRIGLCIDISTRIGLYISIYNRIGLHLGISAVLDCTLVKLLLNFMMTHLTVMDCTCIEGSFEWDT